MSSEIERLKKEHLDACINREIQARMPVGLFTDRRKLQAEQDRLDEKKRKLGYALSQLGEEGKYASFMNEVEAKRYVDSLP